MSVAILMGDQDKFSFPPQCPNCGQPAAANSKLKAAFTSRTMKTTRTVKYRLTVPVCKQCASYLQGYSILLGTGSITGLILGGALGLIASLPVIDYILRQMGPGPLQVIGIAGLLLGAAAGRAIGRQLAILWLRKARPGSDIIVNSINLAIGLYLGFQYDRKYIVALVIRDERWANLVQGGGLRIPVSSHYSFQDSVTTIARAWYHLGLYKDHLDKGGLDWARAELSKANEIYPAFAGYFIDLGQAYEKRSYPVGAAFAYQEFLKYASLKQTEGWFASASIEEYRKKVTELQKNQSIISVAHRVLKK